MLFIPPNQPGDLSPLAHILIIGVEERLEVNTLIETLRLNLTHDLRLKCGSSVKSIDAFKRNGVLA